MLSPDDVRRLLEKLRSLDAARTLFQSLNYQPAFETLSRADWMETKAGENVFAATQGDPQIIATHDDFRVIHCRLKNAQLSTGDERAVTHQLLKSGPPFALYLFSNSDDSRWHFVNVKEGGKIEESADGARLVRRVLRRISVGPGEHLRTASERLALIEIEEGLSGFEVQSRHDGAFDVEEVTKKFFNDYHIVFQELRGILHNRDHARGDHAPGTHVRGDNDRSAHDGALQLLNRLMFLYFIQRKSSEHGYWIGDNANFLLDFWKAYKRAGLPPDSFYEGWLCVLFFEAFNRGAQGFNPGRRDRAHFPERIRDALLPNNAPYLNGGLFKPNRLDEEIFAPTTIPDAFFALLFDNFKHEPVGFLERYNFTISEDSPFDQEVAVDPEMIGKVYETLVNVEEKGEARGEDRRGDRGIFYTPRIEIDLMCRLSLLDYLGNHLPHLKPLLRPLVFALEADEKQEADGKLLGENAWKPVRELLREVTVCDPACGSGAFLVGMLGVLDDLQERANRALGEHELAYDRRKRIIGQSLYGVDVMDWATHVCELRLWLQLVVETDFKREQLTLQPLLPSLSFKVRTGDCLVQEIGGVNFGLHRSSGQWSNAITWRINELKARKGRHYYASDEPGLDKDALEHEERQVFRDILSERAQTLDNQIKELDRKIENGPEQLTLIENEAPPKQLRLMETEWKAERAAKQADWEDARSALSALQNAGEVPFVWDIAFVEIFGGERRGFDIIVGNPPYVRHESIAPPLENPDDYKADAAAWRALKTDYKNKLARSVSDAYPHWSKGRKLAGKSDLYIYFFLHGLRMLNAQGSFCFITSNSWLDVGYGRDLQEFLLKHGHVKMILDNEGKRSFVQADVNTAIALLGAARESSLDGLDKTARFVMFRVPFENALSPLIWEEIEEAPRRRTRAEFRVCALNQRELLREGLERDGSETEPDLQTAKYEGNKWGGKYLRAPDIFISVIEKRSDSLEKLSALCEVEGYIHDNNTGPSFPAVLFLKTVKNISQIALNTNSPGVVDYGVKDVGNSRVIAPILFPRTLGDRHLVLWNRGGVFGKEFYKIIPHHQEQIVSVAAQMNSTFAILQRELIGLVNLGDGAIKFSGDDVRMFLLLRDLPKAKIETHFEKMANRDSMSVYKEIQQPDRRALDEVIFDALKLSRGEREAVYEAVVDLVSKRLSKASSLSAKV